jgi:CRP-like cAMP-binding protein
MNRDNTIRTLKQITGFTDSELDVVLNHFVNKNFKKKTIIIETGKVSDEVYFILKGCIRFFV